MSGLAWLLGGQAFPRAAEANMELRSLDEFVLRPGADGRLSASYQFSLVNHGPARIGTPLVFGGCLPQDILLEFYASRDAVRGGDDDLKVGQDTLGLYCLGAGGLSRTWTSFTPTPPTQARGEFFLFAEVRHTATSGLTDSQPADNRTAFLGKIRLGSPALDAASHTLQLPGADAFAIAGSSIYPVGERFDDKVKLQDLTAEAWILPHAGAGLVLSDAAYELSLVRDFSAANGGLGVRFALHGREGTTNVLLKLDEFRDVKLDEWNHLAIQFDAARKEMTTAINGQLSSKPWVLESLTALGLEATQRFSVGRLQTGTDAAFRGEIDEVRVSDAVRYRTNFTPATRFHLDAHTKALFHFDELPGATVFSDASTNQLDLGAVGGTVVSSTTRSGDMPLLLLRPQWVNGAFSAEVTTSPGLSYLLQRKETVSATNWTTLKTVDGDGATKPLADDSAGAPMGVYRVMER